MTPEENEDLQRRKTGAGILLLISLVIVALYFLSKYISERGPHIW